MYVCPREYISVTTRAIFTKFLYMLPMAVGRGSVLLRQGDEIPRQGDGTLLGVFFPTDKALYIIAFETNTKTTELIEKQFG